MKVHVIGTGVISALGENSAANYHALSNGKHGITADSSYLDSFVSGIPVARVMQSNSELAEMLTVSDRLPRTALLGMTAAKEAVQPFIKEMAGARIGYISGTTVGGMDLTEGFFRQEMKGKGSGKLSDLIYHECGKISNLIAKEIGVIDFVTTLNTACSSSANAIMLASRMIKSGYLDFAIAGGTDALTAFTLNGFNTLLLLDNELCRPFDSSRKGLNLGEGAGYLLLASEKMSQKLGIDVHAEVSGYANASDAYHQTALSEDGTGPSLVLKNALEIAGIHPKDVGYINLHGTATTNNDIAEGVAIKKVFGDNVPAFSSTKAYTGHTLGASGGIEAVFTVQSIVNQKSIAALRFNTPMPETGLIPVTESKPLKIEHALSNSFGFGGNCCSLLFSRKH
ncbi:MAG: beta-ketoacyl-[acyl-carrier-protein] synthase family protein [Bacteroidetes bacterium]|nr:beta-ketoacyl-[acyl-carrier-protein] synthase family protein [Bacteroidota bacterium]